MMEKTMLNGAREGKLGGLRGLVALAMAQDLKAFIVPGPQIARAHGLDLAGAKLPVATTPRHASVLLLLGDLPADLLKAAAISFAQMPRPRAILALGCDDITPLPAADVRAELSHQGLLEGLGAMRKVFAGGAFQDQVEDFDAQVLATRIEYTCPMHPEIVRDEPGSCPKCGMNLVPREADAGAHAGHGEKSTDSGHGAAAHVGHDQHHPHIQSNEKVEGGETIFTCPMHSEVESNEPGSCPKCGMHLVPREAESGEHSAHAQHIQHGDHSGHEAEGETTYTCPMHPEVESKEPGSCSKCGMHLVPRETDAGEHAGHGEEDAHSGHGAAAAHVGHDQHSPHIQSSEKVEGGETIFTCPMHPEVESNEPGSCPKCGMNLVPRESEAGEHKGHAQHAGHSGHEAGDETTYTCPMHPEVESNEPGSCPKCGMHLVPREAEAEKHSAHADGGETTYTCPMHPEVESNEPGSCPKCGMHLVPRETDAGEHAGHAQHTQHAGHGGHEAGGETTYTCPMHPEVESNEPGSCPKCGMHLVPRESEASEHSGHGEHTQHSEHGGHEAGGETTYTCPMHPEVESNEPGSCPKCGMHLVPRETEAGAHAGHTQHAQHGEHSGHEAGGETTYTCPMHPEVESNEPGSCPKCGMHLVPRETEAGAHGAHSAKAEHAGHGGGSAHEGHGGGQSVEGIEPQFMSMIDITKDLPRSSDGLQMDWIDVPFGPFFPGLPGGLGLDFTLDGDTVVNSVSRTLVPLPDPLVKAPMTPAQFKEMLEISLPDAKLAYGLLAVLALENAAKITPGKEASTGRAAALERERMASHLSWLADFGMQTGFGWLADRATAMQLEVQDADAQKITALTPAITRLLNRLKKTPLLRMRLEGIGVLEAGQNMSGPSARASGSAKDERADDKIFVDLGFAPLQRNQGDALSRLLLRCDEISQSLGMIAAANQIERPAIVDLGLVSGAGEAALETARGQAKLNLHLKQGKVVSAKLETPSTRAVALIEHLTDQRELGDALAGVVSLDLSPWEISENASPHAGMGGHS